VGRKLDAGAHDKPRLPVLEWVVGRRHPTYAVKPKTAGSERIQVKATLSFDAIAVPPNVVFPGHPGTGKHCHAEVRARADMEATAYMRGWQVSRNDVKADLGKHVATRPRNLRLPVG
jgi:hypothetical protein